MWRLPLQTLWRLRMSTGIVGACTKERALWLSTSQNSSCWYKTERGTWLHSWTSTWRGCQKRCWMRWLELNILQTPKPWYCYVYMLMATRIGRRRPMQRITPNLKANNRFQVPHMFPSLTGTVAEGAGCASCSAKKRKPPVTVCSFWKEQLKDSEGFCMELSPN